MRALISLVALGLFGCSSTVIDAAATTGTSGPGSGGASTSPGSSAAVGGGSASEGGGRSSSGGGGNASGGGGELANVAWSRSFGQTGEFAGFALSGVDDNLEAHFTSVGSPGAPRFLAVNRAGEDVVASSVWNGVPISPTGAGFVRIGTAVAGTSTIAGLRIACDADCTYVLRTNDAGAGLWITVLGHTTDVAAAFVAVGADLTVRVGGVFWHSMTLGSDSVTVAGDNDTFVACLASDGKPKWLRSIPSAPGDTSNSPNSMSIDAAGNIAVSSRFHGPLDLGDGTTVDGEDGSFVAEFDASGQRSRLLAYGGEGNAAPYLLAALGTDGSIFIAGTLYGTFEFGGHSVSTPPSENRESGLGVAVELAPDGTFRWLTELGTPARLWFPAITPTSNGDVWIGGHLDGPAMIGSKMLAPVGERDALLVALGSSGQVLSARQFGSKADASIDAVTVGADGSMFVTGDFNGTIDFGQGPFNAAPEDEGDGFIARLLPTP